MGVQDRVGIIRRSYAVEAKWISIMALSMSVVAEIFDGEMQVPHIYINCPPAGSRSIVSCRVGIVVHQRDNDTGCTGLVLDILHILSL